MSILPQVNLTCALPSEASPIIETFGLKLVATQPFKTYSKANTRLIISGIGKIRSQAAVEFISNQDGHLDRPVWINYGIAGHRELDLGSAVLADKVSSTNKKTAWYPGLSFDVPCRTGEIRSFDSPVTVYPDNVCCEMEASGFLTAVSKIAPNELSHVLKIISDNARTRLDDVNREFVRTLIKSNVDILCALIERLISLASRLPVRAHHSSLDSILGTMHFTYAQAEELRRLNRRYRALTNNDSGFQAGTGFQAGLEDCATAAQILDKIKQHVDTLPLRPSRIDPND